MLASLAAIFSRFTSALHWINARDVAIQGCLDTFDAVEPDLAAAITISSPSGAGVNATTVQLSRLNPFDTTRFPAVLADRNSFWPPDPYNAREDVTYTFAGGQLTRTVTVNNSTTTTVAANNLNFFQCTLDSVNGVVAFAQLQVVITPSNGVTTSVEREVALHLPPAVVPP
jgi:hypothetical protein